MTFPKFKQAEHKESISREFLFARTSQFVSRRPWDSVLKIIINCYEYLSFHTINVLSKTCSDSCGNGLKSVYLTSAKILHLTL